MTIIDVRDGKFYWLTHEKESAGYNAQIKKINSLIKINSL